MLTQILQRSVQLSRFLSLCLTATILTPAIALDSFRSFDNRLPEPNHPYDMTGGTVQRTRRKLRGPEERQRSISGAVWPILSLDAG